MAQPGVAPVVGPTVGGTGVCVAGTGVLVAGGGSVLTRTPLSGGSVSVGASVGRAGSVPHAASKTANAARVVFILFFFIL
jgi:hypothetical protein